MNILNRYDRKMKDEGFRNYIVINSGQTNEANLLEPKNYFFNKTPLPQSSYADYQ